MRANLLVKPLWEINKRRPRIPQVDGMTIALGLLCHGGVIVAADTLIATGTAASKQSKLDAFKGASGVFALAFASDDVNATRTLLAKLTARLSKENLPTLADVETVVAAEMTSWSSAFVAGTQPAMQIVLAAKLANDGARLFLCEPPNTFTEAIEGYIAAGAGAGVTDPLHSTLFGHGNNDFVDVQAMLRRLSYLMYRAKKDNIYCGKVTHCAIIAGLKEEPIFVNSLDLEKAEKVSTELDFLLFCASTLLLSSTENAIKKNAEGIASMMEGMASIRTTSFHDTYGDLITLSNVQK